MYEVAVSQSFIARHYLIGGDWGPENHPHAHQFKVQMTLSGDTLDRHNYLYDISLLQRRLSQVIECYRDRLLNDLEEFTDQNPSVELFSRVMLAKFLEDFPCDQPMGIKITLWEDADCWVSYAHRLHPSKT